MTQPKGAWQYFEKIPRPLLRWCCILGAAWAMGLCDLLGSPMDGAVRGVVLGFVAAVYGIRGWEKLRQSDDGPEPFAGQYQPQHDVIGGYGPQYQSPDYYRERGQI